MTKPHYTTPSMSSSLGRRYHESWPYPARLLLSGSVLIQPTVDSVLLNSPLQTNIESVWLRVQMRLLKAIANFNA